MEQTDLLAEAINLTLFGMGFVFLFLILLVFTTKFMSFFIQKINSNTLNAGNRLNLKKELDEETKFVIQQAIKMHRET